jgi:RNA polymerase sigma-32 factor
MFIMGTSNTALSTLPLGSLAQKQPWALLPPLGSLDAYISAVNRLPMLTPEEEHSLALKLRQDGDLQAAGQLIMAHLRVVVSVSRKYAGYGLPQADLIQEGNIGLMKAVKRFDPAQGVRLVSYALHWIKAHIHEYILNNWRMVKVASTKAQRKLFFNLRSFKNRLQQEDDGLTASHGRALNSDEVQVMARELRVKPEEVLEMERRMSGGDVSLDPTPGEDEEAFANSPIAYLGDWQQEPTQVIESMERDVQSSTGLSDALEVLDARSKRIIQARWLDVNDDGSGAVTLHDLADEYGVSAERIRQIEVAALKKMRKAMTPLLSGQPAAA